MNYDVASPVRSSIEVMPALLEIERAQLVHRLIEDELVYWFKHTLVQESAYESLLRHQRKQLHLEVAEVLERDAGTDNTKNAALLAYHFGEAGVPTKSLTYALCAGDQAMRLFANAVASQHFAQALRALDALPDTPDNLRIRIDTNLKLSEVAWGFGITDERLAAVQSVTERARALADETGQPDDQMRAAQMQLTRGQALFARNDVLNAVVDFLELLDVPLLPNSPPDLASIPSIVVGGVMTLQGDLATALPILERGQIAANAAPDHWYWYGAISYQTLCRAMMGRITAAEEILAEGLTRATETSNKTSLSMISSTRAALSYLERDWQRTYTDAVAANRACMDSGDVIYRYMASAFRALAASKLAMSAEARTSLQEARALQASIGKNVFFADWLGSVYAETKLELGDTETAIATARATIEYAQSIVGLIAEGSARRVLGQALARQRAFEQAETEFKAAIEIFTGAGAMLETAQTHLAWSQTLEQQGEHEAARAQQTQAETLFQECDAPQVAIATGH